MSQWYPAGQVIMGDRIWLTDNISSDQLIYVALYHINDNGNKDILRYNGEKVYDSSIIEVDEDAFYGVNAPDPSYLPYGKDELSKSKEDYITEMSQHELPPSYDISEFSRDLSKEESNESIELDEQVDNNNTKLVKRYNNLWTE
jgi:hypothetical protein